MLTLCIFTTSLLPFVDQLLFGHVHIAEAAYDGKYQRTVEFVLGSGSDTTHRAANTVVYAGNTWNTTKATASTRNVYLNGTNIRVKNAYLETWHMTNDGATDVGEIRMNISVTTGDSGNTDIPIDPSLMSASMMDNSGVHFNVVSRADVTHVFQQQTDTEWANGVGVVASFNNLDVARSLTAMKLIITYEEDYSTVAHNATKTVRFPLDSTTSGDTGSTRAACNTNTDCIFEYRAEMPDLASSNDILDVWFEMHQYVDGTGLATTSIGIAGAAATTTYNHIEAIADASDRLIIHRVATGSPNFVANATSSLIYRNGASQAVNIVGGEVIVTYRYSTGAATQTETVSYFMRQDTTPTGTASTTFSNAIHIANGGLDVRNMWYRVRTPHSGALTWHVGASVGGGTSQFQSYTLPGTNARAGEAVMYMDLSSNNAGNFNAATTTVQGEFRSSTATGDAQANAELFVTFTWSGSSGGAETKTHRFFGGNSTQANNAASQIHTFPTKVYAPEMVGKSLQSAYVRMWTGHSEATSIAVGTVTFGVNASTTALTEDTDAEAFDATYLHQIATSTFTGNRTANDSSIPWTEKAFLVRATINQGDEYNFSGEIVTTYRAELQNDATPQNDKYQRTVEFVLGNGSDSTFRAANTVVYAGNIWNTTKGTASRRNVYLNGGNIRVKNAYLESWHQATSTTGATDQGELRMTLDASPGDSANTDVPANPQLMTTTIMDNSGTHFTVVARADVTHMFQQQTDTEWTNGVGVVASINNVDLATSLMSMKLIITYEEDYTTAPRTATKTVRFPLDSTVSGDTGSTRASCATNTDCIFEYRPELPDLASTADILDVWFEIHQYVDGATQATTSIGIAGAAATTTYDNFERYPDGADRLIIHRVATGSPNFVANATSSLIYRNGTAQDVHTVGGEVVVTYRYSTGAAQQTETISYYMTQNTTPVGTTKTAFSNAVHIANAGIDVRNVWYRVRTNHTAARTLTVYGTVGAGAEQSQAYTLPGAGIRAGEAVMYMDLSPTSAHSFNAATTTVAGAFQWDSATSDGPASAELFVTFLWDGADGGPQTKTNKFFGGNSDVANPTASIVHSFPVKVYAPENVNKWYQSAYLRMTTMHSEASAIAAGTVTIGVNASTTAPTEDGVDLKAFTTDYLHQIATSTFTGNRTANETIMPWTEKAFMTRGTLNQADEYIFSGEVVTTYRADLAAPVADPEMTLLHYLWRADDGSEVTASALAAEDTAVISGLYVGDKARLRFLISSTGAGAANNITYQLEHSSTSCSVWVPVATTDNGSHWKMSDSGFLVNGQSTTHNAGLSAPGGKSFTSGFAQTSSNQTGAHSLSTAQYTEHEYVINSTSSVTPGTTYCFRLTNAGSTTYFVYTVEPQISVQTAAQRPLYGGGGGEGSGTGPQQSGGGAGGGGSGEGGEGGGGQQGGGGSGGGGGGDSG